MKKAKKKTPKTYVYAITYILKDETVYYDRRPTKSELQKIVKKEFGWDEGRLKEELVDVCLDIEKVRVHALKRG